MNERTVDTDLSGYIEVAFLIRGHYCVHPDWYTDPSRGTIAAEELQYLREAPDQALENITAEVTEISVHLGEMIP